MQTVGFLLLPDFPILAFSAACDPIRMANYAAGREIYASVILSLDGQDVQSSSGVVVRPEASLTEINSRMQRLDVLFLVAGRGIEGFADRDTFTALSRVAARGTRLGALSVAPYVLARAGLLDGYRFTLHWEHLDAFREDFPHLSVTPDLYEIDRDRLTASGGTAALDLMLAMISLEHGQEFADRLADLHVHNGIRDHADTARMPLRTRVGVSHPKLLQAVELIEAGAEESFSRDQLASAVGLSGRQLERLFRKYLDTTPRRYHQQVRLERARRLLQQTSMPVLDVALACGFSTASHFSKSYRERFDRLPSADRGKNQTEGTRNQSPGQPV